MNGLPSDPMEVVYLVDFDDTLAHCVWPLRGIGDPIYGNITKLLKVRKAGYEIVIFTSRPWSDRAEIEHWLVEHEVPFDEVICGKPKAFRYVCDKAINADRSSWL